MELEAPEGVDLLITEEGHGFSWLLHVPTLADPGWGLSSANWLIRRSAWSIDAGPFGRRCSMRARL